MVMRLAVIDWIDDIKWLKWQWNVSSIIDYKCMHM